MKFREKTEKKAKNQFLSKNCFNADCNKKIIRYQKDNLLVGHRHRFDWGRHYLFDRPGKVNLKREMSKKISRLLSKTKISKKDANPIS